MNKGDPRPDAPSQPALAGKPYFVLLEEQYEPPEVISVKAEGLA